MNSRNVTWGDSFTNVNGKGLQKWIDDNTLVRLCSSVPSFPNGNSFLDHFLITPNLVDVLNPNFCIECISTFSDHFPLKLRINFSGIEIMMNRPKQFISFENTDWNRFRADLSGELEFDFPPLDRNLADDEIDRYIGTFSTTVNLITTLHSERNNCNKRYIVSEEETYIVSEEIRKIYRKKKVGKKI